MKVWIVGLLLLGACSTGWSQDQRLEFIGACQDSGMGETGPYLFCACWQDELEESGVSARDIMANSAPNEETTAAMARCM